MVKSVRPWDAIFKREGRYFTAPHQDLPAIAQRLKARQARTVLDMGCGSGRHVVYLARQGFDVFGLDSSPQGLYLTGQWLAERGLPAHLLLHDITDPLPYPDAFFDAIISTQVIHHGDVATIKAIIAEIERVLKPQGFIFITVPQRKNQAKTFREIEPNTYLPLDGPEKGLPHHYFTPAELRLFFKNFDVAGIHLDAVAHYCLSGVKRSAGNKNYGLRIKDRRALGCPPGVEA